MAVFFTHGDYSVRLSRMMRCPYGSSNSYMWFGKDIPPPLPRDLPEDYYGDETAHLVDYYLRLHDYHYLPIYSTLSLPLTGTILLSPEWFRDSRLIGAIYFPYLDYIGMDKASGKECLKEELTKYAEWLAFDNYVASVHKGRKLCGSIPDIAGFDNAKLLALNIIHGYREDTK